MTCTSCTTDAPPGSRFCPSCGSPLSAAPDATAPSHLEAPLAEANLLRVRGQWLAAESRCIDVMRDDPNNLHAHSLLGDIYRDQGRLEEASQWYRLALDLQPDSASDRAKLELIERDRARKSIGPGSFASDGIVGTQKLMGLPPTLWLRGLTAISVGFLVLAIGIALALRRPSGPRALPPPHSLGAGTAGLAGSGQAALGPLPMPTVTSAAHSQSPPAPRPMQKASPAPEKGAAAEASGLTEHEAALQSAVANQLGEEASITYLALDPRDPRGTIALNMPLRSNDAAGIRQEVASIAYRAGHAALTAEPNMQRVALSVRVAAQGARPEPAFSGELDRSALQGLPAEPTADELVAAFANAWWAPAIAPPAPPTPLLPGG